MISVIFAKIDGYYFIQTEHKYPWIRIQRMAFPFVEFIIEKDLEKFKKLLCDVTEKEGKLSDSYVNDLIKDAIQYESYEIFEFLIENYQIDINSRIVNGPGETIFMKRLEMTTSIESILYLLNYVKNINTTDNLGKTALYRTIDIYISLTNSDKNGENSLQLADVYGDIIVELLKRGANPLISSNLTIMHIISYNKLDLLKLCIEHSKYDIVWDALVCSVSFTPLHI